MAFEKYLVRVSVEKHAMLSFYIWGWGGFIHCIQENLTKDDEGKLYIASFEI
jgi:hypothetical protein